MYLMVVNCCVIPNLQWSEASVVKKKKKNLKDTVIWNPDYDLGLQHPQSRLIGQCSSQRHLPVINMSHGLVTSHLKGGRREGGWQ